MPNLTEVAPTTTAPRPLYARSIAVALLLCADLIVAALLCLAHWQRLTLLRRKRTLYPGRAVAAQ